MPPAGYPQDYRVDPFSGADESTSISGEQQIVQNSSPYLVWLNEIPRQDIPSNLAVSSLAAWVSATIAGQTYVNQGAPTDIMYSFNSSTEQVLQAGRDSAGSGGYIYRSYI